MITIKKIGSNNYGTWVLFDFEEEHIVINGIATTKLDKLEEGHTYSNLILKISSKNGKNYYNIVAK